MQNAMSFYTDSSKNPKGAVEAGIFSLEMPGNISHRLPAETFIFSAELWAIFQVILITIDLGQFCVIFSDSRSALDSVQDTRKAHRNYTIYFIKQILLWDRLIMRLLAKAERLSCFGFLLIPASRETKLRIQWPSRQRWILIDVSCALRRFLDRIEESRLCSVQGIHENAFRLQEYNILWAIHDIQKNLVSWSLFQQKSNCAYKSPQVQSYQS